MQRLCEVVVIVVEKVDRRLHMYIQTKTLTAMLVCFVGFFYIPSLVARGVMGDEKVICGYDVCLYADTPVISVHCFAFGKRENQKSYTERCLFHVTKKTKKKGGMVFALSLLTTDFTKMSKHYQAHIKIRAVPSAMYEIELVNPIN